MTTESTVKEKPILMSGAMVNAILQGRKSQTRRVMNPQPSESWFPYSFGEVHKMSDDGFVMRNGGPVVVGWGASNEDGSEAYVSKHGQPGDRLWVKETWAPVEPCFDRKPISEIKGVRVIYAADDDKAATRWKPSIFCPRWASRITLEITGVRVERLNEISEEDALAEGVTQERVICSICDHVILKAGNAGAICPEYDCPGMLQFETAREAYEQLWESINGSGSWGKNPYVWVIPFRRLTP